LQNTAALPIAKELLRLRLLITSEFAFLTKPNSQEELKTTTEDAAEGAAKKALQICAGMGTV
jgi:hypothetical protein